MDKEGKYFNMACSQRIQSNIPVTSSSSVAYLVFNKKPKCGTIFTTKPFTRQVDRCSKLFVRATTEPQVQASAPPSSKEPEVYEVTLPKPLGLRFDRGNDGAAYIVKTDAQMGSTDPQIQVGDKLLKVSASFGSDVWDAKNFGQVMYAIRTRNGDVYLQIQKMYGDLSALTGEEELSQAEKMWRTEQSGGNVGAGTREMQQRNYVARKEQERKRREMFDDALQQFRDGKVEDALIAFENVLSLEPKKYMGDDFRRVTRVYTFTQYNMACCYASLGQIDPGLEALEATLRSGFEDFQKVRNDPNLANLRKSPKFKTLIDQYDEPIINEGAINAIKGLFGFGKQED
eukprot:TRINITY_DN51086_c0_g1_i1.p1 TRINITY_DN51086_c0_g1~~TRINITY_DN51086_c0_g1_i1.p1  ORF type:complete len:344 (-),score=59.02 TRINITY_DN51086_c0_g1_i1:135-1166(-)